MLWIDDRLLEFSISLEQGCPKSVLKGHCPACCLSVGTEDRFHASSEFTDDLKQESGVLQQEVMENMQDSSPRGPEL